MKFLSTIDFEASYAQNTLQNQHTSPILSRTIRTSKTRKYEGKTCIGQENRLQFQTHDTLFRVVLTI